MLATAIKSVAASVVPDDVEWEILVVDNNSTDQTSEVVNRISMLHPGRLRIVCEPRQGLSFARNAGIRESHGEIIAFTDDDVIVEPTWLWNLAEPLNSHEWAGTGGRIIPLWPSTPPDWLNIGSLDLSGLYGAFDMGSTSIPLSKPPFGANMAFRRETFKTYGYFRTDLGRSGERLLVGEETEYSERLLQNGERLIYRPDAVVHHRVQQYQMTKRYLLDRWLGHSVSRVLCAKSDLKPQWNISGVPLRLFLRLFRWSVQSVASLGEIERLRCMLNLCDAAGTIAGAYQLSRKAKKSALSSAIHKAKEMKRTREPQEIIVGSSGACSDMSLTCDSECVQTEHPKMSE
jgi:glycosyltransferase involved in cell wall biosynthesis